MAQELYLKDMRERINNLILLAQCAARFILHGPSKHVIKNPKSVVIVQFGKLGDMVCTTPMFRAIKKADPSTRVIVVGDKVGGQVLAGNTDVDRYIVCGQDIGQALQELQAEAPEAGITTGPSSRALSLLYLAGIRMLVAPRIEGEISSEGRLYRLLRALALVVPHRMGHYAPREYLRLLEPLGILSDDTAKHVAVAPAAQEKVEEFWLKHALAGKRVVGISPSAGNKIKQWPPERFAAVADYVREAHGAAALIVAGPGDAREVAAMRAALKAPAADASGAFSIEELKAAVAKLALFISVDTGPIYIAEALGTPTIDIVGPVDEREQPPVGLHHVIIVPPGRTKPELYVMNPYRYNYAEAVRQVESTSVAQVTAAIDGLLGGIVSK
jgi:heptosyltransferase-2